MREILFRGKRDDNGEWIEGCYVNHLTRMLCPSGDFLKEGDEKHYIVNSGFADWNMPRDLEFVDVIPETIGQFTGLTDKNGKKIFEGDIIKVTIGDNYWISQISTSLKQFGVNLYAIELYSNTSVDELGNFTYEITKNRKNISSSIPSGKNVEIIGNVYDNPELLS